MEHSADDTITLSTSTLVTMRKRASRRRSPSVAFLLFPVSLAFGSTFPQHIVKPAQRIVRYTKFEVGSHLKDAERKEKEESVTIRFSKYWKFIERNEPGLRTEYATTGDVMFHIAVDASVGVDHVDKVFQELKYQNSPNLLSAARVDKSVSSLSKRRLSGHNQLRDESWFRALGVFGRGDSSFVAESENSPVQTEEDLQNAGRLNTGFNVSSDYEYNVSTTIVVGDTTNSTSLNDVITNDTITVLYTKSEACNGTCTDISISNDTNDSMNTETGDLVVGSNESVTFENTTMIGNFSETPISQDSNKTEIETEFRPLRIRAFLPDVAGGGQHLTIGEKSNLLEKMVRPALLAWSAALRVRPVQGNLTVDHSQLHDGNTCGPDSNQLPRVPVPLEHMTEGLSDTDLFIYIGLAFTDNYAGALETNDTDSSLFQDTSDVATNFSQKGSNESIIGFDSNSTVGRIQSIENKNIKNALLSALESQKEHQIIGQKQVCEGDYLAASTFCSTDQFDRPTAALLHICIDDKFFDPSNLATNIRVMMHELGHALGFNAVSMAHFRRQDGSPITKRKKSGAVPLTMIDCTGPITQAKRRSYVALPSPEILKFRTVRNGVRVAEIVTPSVAQVVRNHFDCQTLPGGELESGEFLPLSTYPGEMSCLGDHWERRLFQSDLMNPLVEMENKELNPRFSTLTLAYFADSGWYQADLSRANYPGTWGRGAGCAFVEQPCVSEDGKVLPSYDAFFCTQKPADGENQDSEYTSVIQGCTADLSRKASCSLGRYEGELPKEYQYFRMNYGAEFGGNDPFMDYCPVYAGFSNGLCSDSNNEAFIRVNVVERFGRRNSRCLASQIQRKASSFINESTALPFGGSHMTGLCMPIACVVEDQTLRIQVDGKWRICSQKDETLETTIGEDVVTVLCPDPIRVCPTFYCQRDCLGRTDGRTVCDYGLGECVCNSTSTFCEMHNHPNASNANVSDNVTIQLEPETSSLFFNPSQNKSQLPDPDTQLADYYVPTVRNLKDESDSFLDTVWFWIVLATAGLLMALLIFILWLYRRKCSLLGNTGSEDIPDTAAAAHNPDKHKLMASIVVNLRMNDPALQRRVQGDMLRNRESETDLSMTDTEGTTCHVNDVSQDFASSLSDCEGDESTNYATDNNDDIVFPPDVPNNGCDDIDPLAQPPPLGPAVRRRHKYLYFLGESA